MNISLKYRIFLTFTLLMAICLFVMLQLISRWTSHRVEEEITTHLNQSASVLERIHTSSSLERLSQFKSIAFDSRLRALTEIKDPLTLSYSAKEIKSELNCAAFAFLSESGAIMAWAGEGQTRIEPEVYKLLQGKTDLSTDIFLIDNKVFELAVVPIRFQEVTKGYILGANVLSSEILLEYQLAVGADVEIFLNEIRIVGSTENRVSESNFRSQMVPLKHPLNFRIHLDMNTVSAPLKDTLKTLIPMSVYTILFGGVIILFFASRFSKPIQELTRLTRNVGEGNFSEHAEENGSPEIRDLSRNFNSMLESIDHFQKELKYQAENLDGLVKDRTKDLEQEVIGHKETMEKLELSTAMIQESAQAKEDFLANVSHELRTPLHGILSFAKFGLKKFETAPPEKIGNYFHMIDQSAQSLLLLVNDLLDLAKLEAGKMNFEFAKANFGILVSGVVDEFQSLVSERKITINLNHPDNEIKITHDSQRMKQVVRNLLSNAVKFSSEGGRVEVSVSMRDGFVKTSVNDNGIGIPKDELDTVFDKFIQSSKTKTGTGGTGLGLSICKEIINAHKGRIWASCAPEGGTIFAFELPTNLDGIKEEASI